MAMGGAQRDINPMGWSVDGLEETTGHPPMRYGPHQPSPAVDVFSEIVIYSPWQL